MLPTSAYLSLRHIFAAKPRPAETAAAHFAAKEALGKALRGRRDKFVLPGHLLSLIHIYNQDTEGTALTEPECTLKTEY